MGMVQKVVVESQGVAVAVRVDELCEEVEDADLVQPLLKVRGLVLQHFDRDKQSVGLAATLDDLAERALAQHVHDYVARPRQPAARVRRAGTK